MMTWWGVSVDDVSESMTFTAVYEQVEHGWIQARLAEIPGVISTAPTRSEAEVMLLDALREYLLSFTQPSEPGGAAPLDTADIQVTLTTSAA